MVHGTSQQHFSIHFFSILNIEVQFYIHIINARGGKNNHYILTQKKKKKKLT